MTQSNEKLISRAARVMDPEVWEAMPQNMGQIGDQQARQMASVRHAERLADADMLKEPDRGPLVAGDERQRQVGRAIANITNFLDWLDGNAWNIVWLEQVEPVLAARLRQLIQSINREEPR